MNELDELALYQGRLLVGGIRGVELLGDWEPAPSVNAWMLRMRLELLDAAPTLEIPQYSEWVMVVDFQANAWGKVQVHPSAGKDGIAFTFEHQQYNGGSHKIWPVRNGHICCLTEMHGLAASRNAVEAEPSTTTERIVWYAERALEWIRAAATDTLVNAGDPFELPEYNTGFLRRTISLAYYEDENSFSSWQHSTARAGIASISYINGVAVVQEYLDHRGKSSLHAPSWGTSVSAMNDRSEALWLRLDEVPVVNRWQAPSTFSELNAIVARQGKSLVELLKPSLERINKAADLLLLVGMPIPRKVKQEPFRYHWQALELFEKFNTMKPKIRVPMVLNCLRSSSPVKWIARSENWHPDELQSRGRVTAVLQQANILLIGAGALGANLAEQLVRMGVVQMTVVDADILEAGNLVRHPLDLSVLTHHKALSLAVRLNRSNPSAKVKGLAVPFGSDNADLVAALQSATLIIDASANDDVLRGLPVPSISSYVPIISLSTGIHAKKLFFYADLAANFSYHGFSQWFAPYREQEHQGAIFEDLPRGLGCWHPLTPARLNRIAGLAGCAVELIEQVYKGDAPLPVGHCHDWVVADLKSVKVEEVAE